MEEFKNIDEMTSDELSKELSTLGVQVIPNPEMEQTGDDDQQKDELNQPSYTVDKPTGDKGDILDGFTFEEEKYLVQTPEELVKEMKKLSIQNFNKEKMIQKQALEVGNVRKQEVSLRRAQQEAEELLLRLQQREQAEDIQPEEYERHVIEKHRATNELQRSKIELNAIRSEEWLRSLHPDIDELIKNEVPEIIKKDLTDRGRETEFEHFKKIFESGNWRHEDPNNVNFLLTRAKEQKVIKAKDERIKHLEEAYKKALKEPDSIGKNLSKVSGQTRTIPKVMDSGSLGKDVKALSDSELDTLLKKMR